MIIGQRQDNGAPITAGREVLSLDIKQLYSLRQVQHDSDDEAFRLWKEFYRNRDRISRYEWLKAQYRKLPWKVRYFPRRIYQRLRQSASAGRLMSHLLRNGRLFCRRRGYIYLLSSLYCYRDELRSRWPLRNAYRQLLKLSDHYPRYGGSFDQYDCRISMADPVTIAFYQSADPFFRPAIASFRSVFTVRSVWNKLRLYAPNLLKRNGYFEVALAMYRRLSTTPGMEAEGFWGLADISHYMGRWQREVRHFSERGIHLNAYALFNMKASDCLIDYSLNMYEEANRYYLEALRHAPDSSDILAAHGHLLIDMQEPVPARATFKKALTLEPDHVLAAMRLAQTEALLGNLAETNRLYRCVLGGISLYYRFHRHVAADICSIRQASIKQSSPCEQRLPALELHYNHYVAYHHEIKPYATTIAFDGGYVAEFDSVIDLGLGFILLEGKEPRLLADTKHLPPANYKFFCPTVQMHTETRALLSLPEHMREIDEGPVIIMPSYVQNYYHWICDSLV